MRHRTVRFAAVILTALALVTLMQLGLHSNYGALSAEAAPQVTPTPTTPPVFTATVAMYASAGLIGVGDALRVDIAVKTSPDCQFAHYESTLSQLPEAHFSYLDPPTATAGPPGATTYLLIAEATGQVTLTAQLYGERYCGDFWNWIYLPGPSLRLTVTDTSQLRRTYLPIQRAR